MTSTTVTQYGIDHQGHDLGLTFASREDVDAYVDRAVACGANPANYQVKHRAVTYGAWASTTPAPSQLAAKRGQTCGTCGQQFAGSHVAHYAAAHQR